MEPYSSENSLYLNVLPSYLENSVLKPRPFYYTDFNKSIENIVLEEPEEEKSLPERIFSDKSKTLKATIKALFNEITLRERLDSELLKRIDEDACRCRNCVNELKLLSNPYAINPILTSRRTKLEDEMFKLEQEKRREYLECWRDLMNLKKYLLSGLKDYWLISKRKSSLKLENDRHREHMQETETYNWRQG